MKRLLSIVLLLLAACTSPSYPGIDNPPPVQLDSDNQLIIDYIDKRMYAEYYWLDEVVELGLSFNRSQKWENYLPSMLAMMETNADDGYVDAQGRRHFYSYIRELDKSTRAEGTTMGFGIGLYYVIASFESGDLGFIVDYVYKDSPAEQAGVCRGDIVTSVDGKKISRDNYLTLFNIIEQNMASSVQLDIMRQIYDDEQDANLVTELDIAPYNASPVLHSEVIELDGQPRIGYLVYRSFDREYNEELISALADLSAQGVERMILDLRGNGGGAVESAIKLASALLGSGYAGELLCELRRNPLNEVNAESTFRYLEDVGVSLGIDHLTVICSEYTASASELVIEGLRGLDIPVTLVGSTTQGKNCGMDVTQRVVGNKFVEFAPITFMCYNAKGFGEYGEGLTPDIDITSDNKFGVKDELYPLPRCRWGDMNHDIALVAAVAEITGKSISGGAKTRCAALPQLTKGVALTPPIEGTRLYEE